MQILSTLLFKIQVRIRKLQILFAFYLRTPFDQEAKIRDTCAKLNSSYQITGDEAMKKLNLKEIKNYNNRELANYYCERYLGIR